MALFKLNNGVQLKVPNELYVQSHAGCYDSAHWYMEIFGYVPTYTCNIDIHRNDEDENIDIYSVIFNDLVNFSQNRFSPILYKYGNNEDVNGLKLPHFRHYIKNGQSNCKEVVTEKFCVIDYEGKVMISYEYGMLSIMSHLGTDVINEVINTYIDKYNEIDDKAKCYIIVKDPNMYLEEFSIKLHNDLDFDLYNEGFEDVHNDIVKSIESEENGLYLLYGAPGTGKTTYIRHLIKQCGNDKRKFVYVPISLFGDFTNPSFLPFLLEHKGCVFIIEDCESLVTSNDGVRSEEIANLLNMSDGLLNDALQVKIICTFNIDDGEIDEALLRPGRCRCKYEFDLLKKDRANKIAEKYGLKKVDEDVSLGKLFNPDKDYENKDEKRKRIGFTVKDENN